MIVSEKLSNVLSYFVFFALFGLFINGCNHGRKKHGVELEATNVLLSFYYGAEYFWHKPDYSEMNNNIRVAWSLVLADYETVEPDELMRLFKSLGDFKIILMKYDDDEIAYIKEMVMSHMEIKDDIDTQFAKALLIAKQTRKFNFKINENSTILLKKLSDNGLELDAKDIEAEIEKISKDINLSLMKADSNWVEAYMKEVNIEESAQNSIALRKKIFYQLFD